MRPVFAFFALGEKGFTSIQSVLSTYGPRDIALICSERDASIGDDFYDKIEKLARDSGVEFVNRKQFHRDLIPPNTFCFAIAWRWMIYDPLQLIVFHDSILPQYRGFAPLVNMLKEGETRIGVTALIAGREYDKGPIIGQETIEISYPIKIADAIALISRLYSSLLLRVLDTVYTAGTLVGVEQDGRDATYSVWLDEIDYFINWKQDSEQISRFVDAVGRPYRGAAAFVQKRLVRILDTSPYPDVAIKQRNTHLGKIIFFSESMPVVICGSGLLQIRSMAFEEETPVEKIPFRTRFTSQRIDE